MSKLLDAGYRRVNEIAAIFIEKIQHFFGSLLVTFAHEFFPFDFVRKCALQRGARTHQDSPKFIAPRQRGLTLTAALGLSMR